MMRKTRVNWLFVVTIGLAACSSKPELADSAASATASAPGETAGSAQAGTRASTSQPASQAGNAGKPTGSTASAAAGTQASTPPVNTAQAGTAAGSGGNAQTSAGSVGAAPSAAGMGPSAAGASGAAGVPSAGNTSMTKQWPVDPDGWPVATAADFGLDKAQIDTIAGQLQQASGNTRAGLVIVKEGVLVYEKYYQGGDADTMHSVFSCTKSWGSTLIGIAVTQGLLSVEDPVTKWVPQPAPEVGTGALVKHLLTQTAHTTPPGTAFAYNSGSIVNTLPEVLESASKMSSHAFFEAFLAKPLQLTMVWPPCAAGGCPGSRYKADYIQFGDQGPNGVLQSTIRDQAKLGWLWLNDGMWNGERLLDSAYIQAATKPTFDFQSIYGYLWWLNHEGPSTGPLGADLSYDPKVPNDLYHAVGGIGNCSIGVLPTQRMVIVHVGDLDTGGLGGHWDLFAPLFK